MAFVLDAWDYIVVAKRADIRHWESETSFVEWVLSDEIHGVAPKEIITSIISQKQNSEENGGVCYWQKITDDTTGYS